MSRLKVGVRGLGWAGNAHVRAFNTVEGADVAGVSSPEPLDESDLTETYDRPITVYRSYEDMLADSSIDIIDITSPSHVHTKQAIAAARAGKHVIIEKPIALTYRQLVQLREVIREADVRTCVCFEVRFSEQADKLHSVLEKELIGGVHYGEVDYFHGIGPWYDQFAWNAREDGGGSSLLSAGCHAMDLLLWYMDGDVEEVTSYTTSTDNPAFEAYEYDTTSVTLLKFNNGTIGKVASVIDCLQPYYLRMHLVGSRGSILDDKISTIGTNGNDANEWTQMDISPLNSGDVIHHPYPPQFQAFVDSIQEDRQMPRTNFETAYRTHRAIFAANRSAAEGRPVKLSEMQETATA